MYDKVNHLLKEVVPLTQKYSWLLIAILFLSITMLYIVSANNNEKSKLRSFISRLKKRHSQQLKKTKNIYRKFNSKLNKAQNRQRQQQQHHISKLTKYLYFTKNNRTSIQREQKIDDLITTLKARAKKIAQLKKDNSKYKQSG